MTGTPTLGTFWLGNFSVCSVDSAEKSESATKQETLRLFGKPLPAVSLWAGIPNCQKEEI
jgi:hypothetical protein